MKNKRTFVVGIDASARSTGVVVMGADTSPKEHLIKTPRIKEGERLNRIYSEFANILENKKFVMAVMEGPSYQSTNKPFTLGEVYGIFKLSCTQNRIPLVIIPPRSLKKYAVGTGNAKKEQMVTRAKLQGCSSESNDIADAWFAAKLAMDIVDGRSASQERAAQEVVHNILNGEVPWH